MPGKIVNRLEELREAHSKFIGKNLTLEQLSKDTGIAYTTILRWSKNYIARYDEIVIIQLCDYFNVDVKDLIVYKKDDK